MAARLQSQHWSPSPVLDDQRRGFRSKTRRDRLSIPHKLFHGSLALVLILYVLGDGIPASATLDAEKELEGVRERLAKDPDNYDSTIELASILHHLDVTHPDGGTRVPEAEAAYRKALSRAPNQVAQSGILSNLAALLMSAGRLEDALEVSEECIRLADQEGLQTWPLYAAAHFNIGKILGMLGRKKEADAAFAQAVHVAREVSPGAWGKALAARKVLSDDEVIELEAAIRYLSLLQGQEQQDAQEGTSKPKRRQRRGHEVEMEELKVEWGWLAGASDIDRSWMHFALFSTLDSQGDLQRAWAHLEAANKLQRAHISYNVSNEHYVVDTLRAVFASPQLLRASREVNEDTMRTLEFLLGGKAGYQDPTPIFVVGMARSGSTLVEQILASHPQVYGAGEDTAFAPLIPDILHALERSDLSRLERIGRSYVERMQARVPTGRKVTRIVDKMLRNAWNIGYISVVLPQACLIHVLRHPLDVALSCFSQPFEGNSMPWAWNLTEIAVQIETTHEVMHHWEELFPGKILRVPYERLVADQEGVSRQILEHCGLPWDPAVLEFHTSNRPVQTASLSQVREKLYSSAVGKWKKYEKELKDVQKMLVHLIEEYEGEAGLVPGHDEL